MCLPGAEENRDCECVFLKGRSHVASEDAVQFCVILMNDCQFCCACVFFVCLYLHSEFCLVFFGGGWGLKRHNNDSHI